MNILQATGVALILLAAASHPHAANAASAEAQKAAAPAGKHYGRATEAFAKKALHASAVELSTLADSVQRGAVKDVQVLRKAFVRAEHALGA